MITHRAATSRRFQFHQYPYEANFSSNVVITFILFPCMNTGGRVKGWCLLIHAEASLSPIYKCDMLTCSSRLVIFWAQMARAPTSPSHPTCWQRRLPPRRYRLAQPLSSASPPCSSSPKAGRCRLTRGAGQKPGASSYTWRRL